MLLSLLRVGRLSAGISGFVISCRSKLFVSTEQATLCLPRLVTLWLLTGGSFLAYWVISRFSWLGRQLVRVWIASGCLAVETSVFVIFCWLKLFVYNERETDCLPLLIKLGLLAGVSFSAKWVTFRFSWLVTQLGIVLIASEWLLVGILLVVTQLGRVVVIISSSFSRSSISFNSCYSWTSVESGKGCISSKLSTWSGATW